MKTLVITSCTGEKRWKPENQLVQEDFKNKKILACREKELSHFKLPAAQMYMGKQHLRLMEGITTLRSTFGRDVVDLYILSAGYGLIPEDKEIVPYEVTFSDMTPQEIIMWSRFLRVHQELNKIIGGYDLVIFLLGDKYLRALELPAETREGQGLLFLASKTSKGLVPKQEPYHFIEVGKAEASAFGYGLIGLKGYIFKLFAREVVSEGRELLRRVCHDPDIFMKVLNKYKKNGGKRERFIIFPDFKVESLYSLQEEKQQKRNIKKEIEFAVKKEERAKNYGLPVKYFIPEWDDRVDPNYDFFEDRFTEGRDPYLDDVYAHEIYDRPNYDGVLISKIVLEESNTKIARAREMGVHRFIRFWDGPIMGDCGAFGYVDEICPPFETKEILNYYQELGFDLGVSIDHLIVGEYAQVPAERKRRFKITQDNAAEFITRHREGDYTFIPVGVAQGWDPASYREAAAALIDMGYEYIALGGLARAQSKEIFEVMKAIAPIIPDYLKVHLFGVARIEPLQIFRALGMTSFDSASYLRKAWLSNQGNYFTLQGDSYAAIRVPPVGKSLRIKRLIKEGKGTYEQFLKLERMALDALRKFERGLIGAETALEAVMAYDELLGDGRERNRELYRRVLEDRPWEKCDCKICRSIGIDVIIFRGNNRNRRRGFHNTYVFYQMCKQRLKRE